MAKAKGSKKSSQPFFPQSHDVYGYIALGIILVVLFVLLTGVKAG